MISLVQAAKKTVLVIFWLILFLLLVVFFAVIILVALQWFMHTEFYLNMVTSVGFLKWVLGVPIIFTILLFCASIK